jgi:hypothetical protein
MSQFGEHGGRVLQKLAFELRIGPCSGNHLRAVVRSNTRLVLVNQLVKRGRVDQPLLH